MKPYEDNHIRIYNKDCRDMSELPDTSVQMVCTSPPYWGLRKYAGLPDLVWGGDNHCEHQWDIPTSAVLGFNTLFRPEGETSTPLGLPSHTGKYAETVKGGADRQQVKQVGNFCSLCGAWKGSYGLEPTPEMYIQHTIEILREIRRVLRKDGVVFWNIGDSYAAAQGGRQSAIGELPSDGEARTSWGRPHSREDVDVASWSTRDVSARVVPSAASGLKPKDLCLIPFKVAIAAQEDGWWVRSVIIWSKPNPMPESVTDRPTESHEYILMLTKSSRYYWDADAVREPHSRDWTGSHGVDNCMITGIIDGQEPHKGFLNSEPNPAGRNIRTVWDISTQPYPKAHFAVFPEKLPELCIKAATPEVGCCSKCGAPWVRVTKPTDEYAKHLGKDWADYDADAIEGRGHSVSSQRPIKRKAPSLTASYKTLGWQPTCKCNADKVPSLVLDPFLGTGTTLWVAKKLGRRGVGYELSEAYCALSLERNRQMVMELTPRG